MAEKSISEKRREKMAKKAAEDAAGLSIAERLTRASKSDRIRIPLKDADGEFFIEMREPLSSERVTLREAVTGFEGRSIKEQEKAETTFAELLADFCIDESLNVAFWKHGDYTPSKLQRIVLLLLGLSADQMKAAQEVLEAQSFRQNRDGAGAVAANGR